MLGPIDVGSYFVVVLFSFLFIFFRTLLKYKNSVSPLVLFVLVLTVTLMGKLFCCLELYKSFALYRYYPFLDQAVGFAAGPVLLYYVLQSLKRKHRYFFLHFIFSAAAFVFFLIYILQPAGIRELTIVNIINRDNRIYFLLNALLLCQFTVYLGISAVLISPPGWFPYAVLPAYLLFFPVTGVIYLRYFRAHHLFFLFAVFSVVVFIAISFRRRYLTPEAAYPGFHSEAEMHGAARDILEYFREEKPYLDKQLTMSAVSETTGLSRQQLSVVFNTYFAKHYTVFVAEYRVEEAKLKIQSGTADHLTLEHLGYECGFNSKSSFFTHFKACTGITPAQYMKKLRGGGGPGGGSGKKMLYLAAFTIVFSTALSCLAGCTKGKVPSKMVLKRMYGSMRADVQPYDGAMKELVLYTDGTCTFRWHRYNGEYSYRSGGTYILRNGSLTLSGGGVATNGYRKKAFCNFEAEGGYVQERKRWELEMESVCAEFKKLYGGSLFLYEGIATSLVFHQIATTRKYLFWGVFVFFIGLLFRRERPAARG